MSDTLVIYYSQSPEEITDEQEKSTYKGNTQIAAEVIQQALNCDIFRVELDESSTNKMYHSSKGKLSKMTDTRPVLKNYLEDISGYKNIFVCGPNWYRTFPAAIFTAVENLDFTDKKVICLITHEGSGVSECVRDLRRVCRGASFGQSFDAIGSDVQEYVENIAQWAKYEVQ